MKGTVTHIAFLLAFIFSVSELAAQVMLPSARANRSEIRIGEQVLIDLSIEYRLQGEAPQISFPVFKDTLVAGVEILEATDPTTTRPDSIKEPDLYKVHQQILITSFDSGMYFLRPIPVIVNGAEMYSNALKLAVNTVAVDTTQMAIRDIKDIKDVQLTAFDYFMLFWWIALIVVLIGVIIGVWAWYRKKMLNHPGPELAKPEAPVIPPHTLALQGLQTLEEKKLWQAGKIKLYHTELTDIIREYIEQRYAVSAHEQTSDEILSSLKFGIQREDALLRLRQLLKTADLVKFAKHKPGANENELSMTYAREFVEWTAFVEPQPAQNEQ